MLYFSSSHDWAATCVIQFNVIVPLADDKSIAGETAQLSGVNGVVCHDLEINDTGVTVPPSPSPIANKSPQLLLSASLSVNVQSEISSSSKLSLK